MSFEQRIAVEQQPTPLLSAWPARTLLPSSTLRFGERKLDGTF